MTTDRFDIARRLAAQALGLPASQRSAAVAQLCGSDLELRKQVEAMIRSHEAATIVAGNPAGTIAPDTGAPGSPLGASPGPKESAERAARALPPGTPARFGNYAIREVLGEGGMGVVYLAEQDRPRRVVALKVIRPGTMSPRMLRRFEFESQTLARLQHPGIAQIFEAGVVAHPDGSAQPFFAMEFVRGVALTAFAAAHDLDIRRRLGLFVKVCEAVEHAHQKGVIHRDLKPANILVDTGGQPKVLDFGVARATDDDAAGASHRSMLTEAGQLVGTIPYMSPEQIAGNIDQLDTRSDVYTLGVILYELLTGRLPHEVTGKTIVEAARVISSDRVTPLGEMNRSLRGELQTVVSKAMERDVSRRYQSAAELAADITRYLRFEPIFAKPPSLAYLARKFAQRNRGLVTGLCVALVLLALGVAGTLWQAVRATRGWERAAIEAANATAASEFLSDMLASADPENSLGREVTVRQAADEAARSVSLTLADRPKVEQSVQKALASTYRGLDMLEEAEKHARRALDLARREYPADDPAVIDASRVLVTVLTNAGKFDEAERLAKENLAAILRSRGREDPDTSIVMSELARVYQETGRFKEAEPLLTDAIALGRRTRPANDIEAAGMLHNLSTLYKDQGRFEQAESILRELLDLRTRYYGRQHPQTAFALNNLAAVLQKREKYDEALSMMREALAIREQTLGPDHQSTVTSRMNLAVVLVSMGKLDEGEPLIRAAVDSYTRTLGAEHPKTLISMGNLAYVLEDRGQLDEAESLYRRIIDTRRRTTGGKDPETWNPMNNLAMLLQKQGQLAEAEGLYRELLAMCDEQLPADHPSTAIFRNNYGDLLVDLHRYDEARRALTASLSVLERKFGPDHPRVAKAKARLTRLDEASGR